MMGSMPETVMLTQADAVCLMALHVMLRSEEITLRRNAFRAVPEAETFLASVAQECALQLFGVPDAED